MKKMSTDLLRQRRNLIIISSLMWFLKYANVQINKFSVLGIQFNSFENPHALFVALWIAWIYFIFRYYQYFIEEGLPEVLNVYYNILNKTSLAKINKFVENTYPDNTIKQLNYLSLKNNNWIYYGQIKKSNDDFGEIMIENFTLHIPPKIFWFDIIKTLVTMIINKTTVTDYILPLLFSLSIISYCLNNWDGSFFAILKLIF